MKEYTSKELNEIIGYIDESGRNSSKKQLMTRCINAGLIIEALPTKRGCPNKYIIIKDEFHQPGEKWVDCYCNSNWEVSNLGRIRRKNTKKLLGYSFKDDYIRVCMIDEKTNKSTNKSLNRLVFFSFHPEMLIKEKQIQIDHINGVRTDNRLENLRPLSAIRNTKERDSNQGKIRTLETELINKIGYEKVEEILKELLTNA